MNVDLLIKNFRFFLGQSWSSVRKVIKDDDVVSDWMQANWEILVEVTICKAGKEFLNVYGDGADCNGASSRVWLPNAIATHQVCVQVKDVVVDELSGEKIFAKTIIGKDIIFDQFVSWNGQQYEVNSPFDYALVSFDGRDLLVSCDAIKFELKQLKA